MDFIYIWACSVEDATNKKKKRVSPGSSSSWEFRVFNYANSQRISDDADFFPPKPRACPRISSCLRRSSPRHRDVVVPSHEDDFSPLLGMYAGVISVRKGCGPAFEAAFGRMLMFQWVWRLRVGIYTCKGTPVCTYCALEFVEFIWFVFCHWQFEWVSYLQGEKKNLWDERKAIG